MSKECLYTDLETCAEALDAADTLACFRSEFLFPSSLKTETDEVVYLCGNSLGLQPKGLKSYVNEQLTKWGDEAVEGHFTQPSQWLTIDDSVQESLARLVGALPTEIVAMNSLTTNLHLMMCAFYKPTSTRNKILIEKKAFPSDYHVVYSQIRQRGFDPSESILEVAPREGGECILMDDIEELINREGQSIALVLLCGVQYYTGQLFDMARISKVSSAAGCVVGYDLAHAVGNVPLSLHDWGCDFACWCSYKYLNCGPGAIGGCFVHERHSAASSTNSELATPLQLSESDVRLCGWWGHRIQDRFLMAPDFFPSAGAYGYRLSNPPVLLISCLRASLDLFDKVFCDNIFESKLFIFYNSLELLLISTFLLFLRLVFRN